MRLTKHHGLGNDFLVLLDPDDTQPVDGDIARALCDRRRGIGADGLIRVGPGSDGAEVTMSLHNSDGSPAEMSGNGIRCLGQALAMDRSVSELDVTVATAGGSRRLVVGPGPEPDGRTAQVRVDMGEVAAGPPLPASSPGVGAWLDSSPGILKRDTFDLGNPHLVLLVDDPTAFDIAADGPVFEAGFPDGVNVEWIAPAPGEVDTLDLRVWERGAGITEACGTGACAAASAAARWGLVGHHVTVRMPGGAVEVVLGGEEGAATDAVTLIGPATYIATIEVPWP